MLIFLRNSKKSGSFLFLLIKNNLSETSSQLPGLMETVEALENLKLVGIKICGATALEM